MNCTRTWRPSGRSAENHGKTVEYRRSGPPRRHDAPSPCALERDLDGRLKPNVPAEKAVRFPKLTACDYLVTLVTKNGEDVGLSMNDGAYVQADGMAGQRSEATGALLVL